MSNIKKIVQSNSLAAAIALAAVCALPAHAASVTVGNNVDPNCYPFSCLASDLGGTGSTYQQVYSSTAFSGPLSFNTISFFQSIPSLMDSASYTISFSTTSAAVNGLDGVWANNIGGDSQLFGTFNVSGSMPSVLSFTGNTFNYNPLAGNLLMHVDVFGLTASNRYVSFFQADYTGIDTSRLYAYGGSPEGTLADGALRTEFSNMSAVPEPETYAMMIAGLGLLGFAARRRKQKAV